MMRPAMEQLLQGYFNLDWIEDYDSPWDVVEAFARDESELAERLPAEIADVLSNMPTEENLRNLLLNEFFCGYLPTADGWTYRAWLQAVADRVEQTLHG
jgi:hypothetical protein